MEKFEKVMDLVNEVDRIKEKIAFMGEVTAAFALRTDTAGFGDTALAGLCQINGEIENQCSAVSDALINDFFVIEKSAKEAHLDNFCGAIENGIKK